MKQLKSKPTLTLLLLTLALSGIGCCGEPTELRWRLMERHADPTGRVRLTPNVDRAESVADGATVVIPGHVSGEMEVSRWTTYECKKIYHPCGPKYVTVVDPPGHPGVEVDPQVLPDQISGIPREPTGLGWTPLDGSQLPAFQVRWSLPEVSVVGKIPTGTSSIEGNSLRFKLVLSGDAVIAAARKPAELIKVHFEIISDEDPVKVQKKGGEVEIPRALFVQAASNVK